jgi:hypothetical protein
MAAHADALTALPTEIKLLVIRALVGLPSGSALTVSCGSPRPLRPTVSALVALLSVNATWHALTQTPALAALCVELAQALLPAPVWHSISHVSMVQMQLKAAGAVLSTTALSYEQFLRNMRIFFRQTPSTSTRRDRHLLGRFRSVQISLTAPPATAELPFAAAMSLHGQAVVLFHHDIEFVHVCRLLGVTAVVVGPHDATVAFFAGHGLTPIVGSPTFSWPDDPCLAIHPSIFASPEPPVEWPSMSSRRNPQLHARHLHANSCVLFGLTAELALTQTTRASSARPQPPLTDGQVTGALQFFKKYMRPNGPYLIYPSFCQRLSPLPFTAPVTPGFYPLQNPAQFEDMLAPAFLLAELQRQERSAVTAHYLVWLHVTACLNHGAIIYVE